LRQHIRDFVQYAAEHLPLSGPVYEFGSRVVHGAPPERVDLRSFFPGYDYVGADIVEGPGVDLLLDMCAIDRPDEIVGTVLCLETLEHVRDPWTAMQECHRVLGPGGALLVSSVMGFAIHSKPDYYRFTPQGFEELLSCFESQWVDWAGDPGLPHTVAGIGFKGPVPSQMEELIATLEQRRIFWKWEAPYGYCNPP